MDINEYLSKMEALQQALISFIDSESEMEENFQILLQIFEDHKIRDDRNELKLFFKLITKISNHFIAHRIFSRKLRKLYFFLRKKSSKSSAKPNFLIFLRITNEFFYFYLMRRSFL